MEETLPAFVAGMIAAGYGVDGVTLFTGPDADLPDSSISSPAIISIRETGGEEDSTTHNGDVIGHPSYQITVRHARSATASALIHKIHKWSRKFDESMGGLFWLWIIPQQRPFDRGQDANRRTMMTFNVRTAVRD